MPVPAQFQHLSIEARTDRKTRKVRRNSRQGLRNAQLEKLDGVVCRVGHCDIRGARRAHNRAICATTAATIVVAIGSVGSRQIARTLPRATKLIEDRRLKIEDRSAQIFNLKSSISRFRNAGYLTACSAARWRRGRNRGV
jgi:hypothetical protein